MSLYLSFLNSYGAENLAQSNRRIPRLMMPGSWYDSSRNIEWVRQVCLYHP